MTAQLTATCANAKHYSTYQQAKDELKAGVTEFNFKFTIEGVGALLRPQVVRRIKAAGFVNAEDKGILFSDFLIWVRDAREAAALVKLCQDIHINNAMVEAGEILESEHALARKNTFRKLTFRKPVTTKFTGLDHLQIARVLLGK